MGVGKRYKRIMPKPAIDFMTALLKVDPKDRMTALDALKHPYFKGLNDEFLEGAKKL